MAADTRPYKSKEQDGQGNEVIIRDQQLVEQSTVTTMPSGACFETLDIDGRPVKIPRDNMMSIVLECIGIVLNDSSKNLGTNVNKALGLQGNTIGNVTVNDFASVLGVKDAKGEMPTSVLAHNESFVFQGYDYGLFYIKETKYQMRFALFFIDSQNVVTWLSADKTYLQDLCSLSMVNGNLTVTNIATNNLDYSFALKKYI